MRGRVQGVERRARGRVRLPRLVVRQHGRAERGHVAARRVHRTGRAGCVGIGAGSSLVDVVRRVQALHACGVSRRVPDRRDLPYRVRHRRRASGRVQRMRILRRGVPVRGDRPAEARRSRVEVHDVLRPAARWARARMCEGLSDRVDPVRSARRAAAAGTGPRRGAARARRFVGASVPRHRR